MADIQHAVDDDGWTDWILADVTHRIGCCDCGLVHDVQFRDTKGLIEFRARRNERLTEDRRREKP